MGTQLPPLALGIGWGIESDRTESTDRLNAVLPHLDEAWARARMGQYPHHSGPGILCGLLSFWYHNALIRKGPDGKTHDVWRGEL